MKITAIGVHSAFAIGSYEEVISVKEVRALLLKVAQKDITQDLIAAEMDKLSQRYYKPRWQSNFLIEFDMPSKRGNGPYRLLIDAGSDLRHALKSMELSSADIDGIYISHPHNDHIGGMEYLALTSFFNPYYTQAKKDWLQDQFIADKLLLENEWWPIPPNNTKPDLFIHRKVLDPLKRALGPGLDTLQGVHDVSLETYFDIHILGKQENGQTKKHTFQEKNGSWTIIPIFAMHVISSSEEMPSYGINLQHTSGYNILMPTDIASIMPPQLKQLYKRANRIYMDCETTPFPSGVHPHLSELINKLDKDIQTKCLLYHYDKISEYSDNMFYYILKQGDSHTYPDTEFLATQKKK